MTSRDAEGFATERMSEPLGMTEAQMRALGHQVVDLVVDRILALPDAPALRSADPRDMPWLDGQAPDQPGDPAEVITFLADQVLPLMQRTDHPRYFARVPGPAAFAAIAGDWLASGTNAIAASWGGGAGPSALETTVVGWMRQWTGLPASYDGVLTGGGSLANLTALTVARRAAGPGVVYLSTQTHAVVARALDILGAEHVRILPTDGAFRLTAATVAQAIEADVNAGLTPAIVCASAGTTNTGSVDELDALADLATERGLWLHVDGAYGAPAALTERGSRLLAGMGRADSLVLDPHKWLFTPYDAGCVLVRGGLLASTFTTDPEYLRDTLSAEGRVELRNMSPELSRRARAVKLYMLVATYGLDAVRAGINAGLDLAEYAGRVLGGDALWQIVTEPTLGIVTFRRVGADDAAHRRAAAALTSDGFAAVTCTLLGGQEALRLCTINPRTTHADIDETVARLARHLDGAVA